MGDCCLSDFWSDFLGCWVGTIGSEKSAAKRVTDRVVS